MLSEEPDDIGPRSDVNRVEITALPQLTRIVSKPIYQKKFYAKTQSEIINMLETEPNHKDNLSPFNPLPAIGQRDQTWEDRVVNSKYEKQIKSGKEINFQNVDVRKSGNTDYYVLSVNNFDGNLRGDSCASRLLQRSVRKLNDLNVKKHNFKFPELNNNNKEETVTNIYKSNRSKDLERLNSYRVLENSSNLKNSNDIVSNSSHKPTLPHALSKAMNHGSDSYHSKTETDGVPLRYDTVQNDTAGALSEDKSSLDRSCASIALGSKLFEKREKLLERRKRESFPSIDERAIKDLQEHMELKSKAKNESKELDYSSSSDGEAGSTLPKISKLVGIFKNVQIAKNSRRKVKKTNNWF